MTHHAMHAKPFRRRYVGGIPFEVSSIENAVAWILERSSLTGPGVNVRLANAYNVALANSDVTYRELLLTRGINFPDGMPVVWAMNAFSSERDAGRVRGPSLFIDTLRVGTNRDTRHFFLGSTSHTLHALESAMKDKFPHIKIAGSFAPPFAEVDEDFVDLCARQIERTKCDIVWVGLGTPKQDYVGTELAERLGMVTVNVGAAFDFAAGTVKEAPRWVQSSGFEWLYRMMREPRRLWRRYIFGNATFIRSVASNARADRSRS